MTDTSAPARITSIRWPLLLVLASLAAVAPVATDLYLPGLPEIAADLRVTPSAVQLTLTSFLAGLAFGQLVMGPMSDRLGRRGPLVVSASICVAAGVVCAIAPNLPVLVLARLVQGFAGAGGMVIGRAIIADVVTGRAAARAFTLMITVGGVAPVLAPLVGGLLADPVGWRGMLWTVAALCAAMLLGVLLVVPETHPADVRRASGATLRDGVRTVMRTSAFRAPLAVFALSFGVMMAYISSSPFVYQNVVGLHEIGYAIAFGVNAAGLIGLGWVASRLVDRWPPRTMVRTAVAVQLLGTFGFLGLALADAPAWLLPIPIFVAVASNGAIMGNSASLAMAQVRPVAGTGSAVLGFAQFGLGAIVAPLVGLGGEASAVVPALVMTVSSAFSFLAALSLAEPAEVSTPLASARGSTTETAASRPRNC